MALVPSGYNGAYTGQQIDAAIAKINSIGDIPTISMASATLYSGSWTLSGGKYAQTVQISGVKATGQNVRLSPVTKADADAWASAGCWCTAQAENALTFTCDTVPAQDIQLNVEMQEVQS